MPGTYGRFSPIVSTDPVELTRLNDMLRWLFSMVQGRLTFKEMSEVSEAFGGHSTQIEQNAENISSVATALESTNGVVAGHTSQIQQNAAQILLRVMQGTIGGANLIKDGSFEFGGGAWAAAGSGIAFTAAGRTGGVCASITGAPGAEKNINQTVTLGGNTGKFTVSGYMKGDGIVPGSGQYVLIQANVKDGSDGMHYFLTAFQSGTFGWTRYHLAIDPSGWEDPTIASIQVMLFGCDFTGTIYFDDIQVEEGGEPTAWKPHAGELKNSSVTITDGKVQIAAALFELLFGTAGGARFEFGASGGAPYIDGYNSGNVRRVQYLHDRIRFLDAGGTLAETISVTTANMTVTVGPGKDYPTIQGAVNSIPKSINHTVRVLIDDGTYPENVSVKGFSGSGCLKFEAQNSSFTVQQMVFVACSLGTESVADVGFGLVLYDAVVTNSGGFALLFLSCGSVVVNNVSATGSGGYGLKAVGSNVALYNSTFSNKSIALWAGLGSAVMLYSGNGGSGNTYALKAYDGGIIAKYNSSAPAGTYQETTSSGGLIVGAAGMRLETVWTSDNDGPGSGLAADLLDDLHAAQILPYGRYNYTTGYLVRTDISDASYAMMTLTVTGNGYYSGKNIFIAANLYNYGQDGGILYANATALDYCPTIYAFAYDGRIYFWVQHPNDYCSMLFNVQFTNSGDQRNHVESIADAAKPASGVTHEVAVTPRQVWHSKNFGRSRAPDYAYELPSAGTTLYSGNIAIGDNDCYAIEIEGAASGSTSTNIYITLNNLSRTTEFASSYVYGGSNVADECIMTYGYGSSYRFYFKGTIQKIGNRLCIRGDGLRGTSTPLASQAFASCVYTGDGTSLQVTAQANVQAGAWVKLWKV